MTLRLPEVFRNPMLRSPTQEAPAGGPAAGPSLPSSIDCRNRGVIGPLTDQGWRGSCVSFATTGLVGAMVAVEQGGAASASPKRTSISVRLTPPIAAAGTTATRSARSVPAASWRTPISLTCRPSTIRLWATRTIRSISGSLIAEESRTARMRRTPGALTRQHKPRTQRAARAKGPRNEKWRFSAPKLLKRLARRQN